MTREEIMELGTGKELDALIAEKVMGWKLKYNNVSGYNWIHERGIPAHSWKPSSDITTAYEMESVFEQDSEKGAKYAIQLHNVLGLWLHEPTTLNDIFLIVHATAEQRCKAALLAMMEVITADENDHCGNSDGHSENHQGHDTANKVVQAK